MVDKFLTKWMIMKVSAIVMHGNSEELINLQGEIIKSNFIREKCIFEMPVLSRGSEEIQPGDHIRITFFTRESTIHVCENEGLGFMDEGLRYERLVGDAWDLIYEDSQGGADAEVY